MKAFGLIACFITFVITANLADIRENYTLANNDADVANKLHDQLSKITKKDKAILIAYKGAVSTIKAKHAKGVKQKKTFFKNGVSLLEYAVEKAPNNIEIRCIRLGVQENSPKFLKYKTAVQKDKQFLLDNFKNIKSTAVRKFVKGYILQSKIFTTSEKQLF